jgi:hypothetical protein
MMRDVVTLPVSRPRIVGRSTIDRDHHGSWSLRGRCTS